MGLIHLADYLFPLIADWFPLSLCLVFPYEDSTPFGYFDMLLGCLNFLIGCLNPLL
jgi:hypothetical protein